jgi:hypothetical protein
MNSLICPFIYAAGYTTAFIAIGAIQHKMRSTWLYGLIFIVLFCGYYFLAPSKVQAQQECLRSYTEYQIPEYEDIQSIDLKKFKKLYYNPTKVKYHKEKAFRAFCEAEDTCIFLPSDKREIAYALFEAAVEASVGMAYGGMGGVCATLIIDLARYGIFVYKQSEKIREKLEEAEYHFNMAEYYS